MGMKCSRDILFARRLKLLKIFRRYTKKSKANSNHDQEMSSAKPFHDIPGPKPIPILGNIWRYLPFVGEYSFKNLLRTYEKMYLQYGPLVREQIIGDKVVLHVFKPEDMVQVYKCCGLNPMRESHRILAKYRQDRPHIYKSAGLFPSNGVEWYRFRRLFQKFLLHPDTANEYSGVLEDITDDLVATVHRAVDSQNEVEFLPLLFKWALECVGAITLNRRMGCLSTEENEEVKSLVQSAHNTHRSVYMTEMMPFLQFDRSPTYKRLVAAQDCLANIVSKYIEEAISNQERLQENYLLSRMISNPDADYKDVFTMVLDLFLAGIDTTAYTTGFALYNLCKNPDVQEKLRAELMRNMPGKMNTLNNKLDEMTYLQDVVTESLRMNPVAIGNGRILPCKTVLSGYEIPANTNITLQHQVASLQEENFHQAKVFMPERWMDSPAKPRMPHAVTSVAFGFGARTCVGRRFAQREMHLAIGKLLRNFKVEYHHEDIDIVTQLINLPSKPFKFRFIPLEK